MSQNGKGDDTRPRAITRDEYYDNYERTFGKKKEEDSVYRHTFQMDGVWEYDSEPAVKMLPGWYFWDEVGVYAHGPFNTQEDAAEGLRQYAKQL